MSVCQHPDDQIIRSIYYTLCGACKQVLIVTYCNYARDCHPDCTVASACVQDAREKHHADVTLMVPAELLSAALPAAGPTAKAAIAPVRTNSGKQRPGGMPGAR